MPPTSTWLPAAFSFCQINPSAVTLISSCRLARRARFISSTATTWADSTRVQTILYRKLPVRQAASGASPRSGITRCILGERKTRCRRLRSPTVCFLRIHPHRDRQPRTTPAPVRQFPRMGIATASFGRSKQTVTTLLHLQFSASMMPLTSEPRSTTAI